MGASADQDAVRSAVILAKCQALARDCRSARGLCYLWVGAGQVPQVEQGQWVVQELRDAMESCRVPQRQAALPMAVCPRGQQGVPQRAVPPEPQVEAVPLPG